MIEIRVTCDFPGCGESLSPETATANVVGGFLNLLGIDLRGWGGRPTPDERGVWHCPTHRAGTQEGK